MPDLTDLKPQQKLLVKDLVIDALRRNRKTPGTLTRVQVKAAWQWIEWLDGPGEPL